MAKRPKKLSKVEASAEENAPIRIARLLEEKEFEEVFNCGYAQYSLATIKGRAIPSVEDGLLPVMRRSIFGSYIESKGSPESKFTKAAAFVGKVLGSYHPHGDSSLYESMVKLAQHFSRLNPIFDPQGNSGSVDGSKFAAMRYLEMRLSKFTRDVYLKDNLNLDCMKLIPNFDNTKTIPQTLQSAIPMILNIGITGIASGYTSSIPTHNVKDIVDVTKKYIKNPEQPISKLVEDFRPDFPLGGIITNEKEVSTFYETGVGVIRIEANIDEEKINGKQVLVVKDLPYGVTTDSVLNAIRNGLLPAGTKNEKDANGHLIGTISNVADEADTKGKKKVYVRLVITPTKNTDINILRNLLLKHTPLRTECRYETNVLINDKLVVRASIKDILEGWLYSRRKFIRARCTNEMQRLIELNLLRTALKKAHKHIDKVFKLIKESEDQQEAVNELMGFLDIGNREATYITEIKFHHISKVSVSDLDEKIKSDQKRINELSSIISDQKKIDKIIIENMESVCEAHGKAPRFTKLENTYSTEEDIRDLIEEEDLVVGISVDKFIFTKSSTELRETKGSAKGINFLPSNSSKVLQETFSVNTHDDILCFTDKGRVLKAKGYEFKVWNRSVGNIVKLEDESVTCILPITSDDQKKDIVLCSEQSMMKRITVDEVINSNRNSLIVMKPEEGDRLISGALVSSDKDNIMVVTAKGLAQRLNATHVSLQGRLTRGMPKLTLEKGDYVINQCVGTEKVNQFMVAYSNGKGKTTDITDFPLRRGESGRRTPKIITKLRGKDDVIVGCAFVTDSDKVIFNTTANKVIKIEASKLPHLSRTATGNKMVTLESDVKVVSVAVTKE